MHQPVVVDDKHVGVLTGHPRVDVGVAIFANLLQNAQVAALEGVEDGVGILCKGVLVSGMLFKGSTLNSCTLPRPKYSSGFTASTVPRPACHCEYSKPEHLHWHTTRVFKVDRPITEGRLVENGSKVGCRDVLGGVHPKASDTEVQQALQVSCNFRPDIRVGRVEICE